MTVVKSNKKRTNEQLSMTRISCYAFLLFIVLSAVLSRFLDEEEPTKQMSPSFTKKGFSYSITDSLVQQKEYDTINRPAHYKPKVGLEGIISGDLHLISLSGSVSSPGSSKPYNVHGTFCHLDWFLHKANPSTVPMNKDLISQSKYCDDTKVTMDLYEVVTKAREHDQTNLHHVSTMVPTGFVFHESRVGSTLVANSLAAFDPERNRVYSESAPPISAAKLYDPKSKLNSLQLMRDVVFMMGRTNDKKEKDLFFKIQSIGVKSISIFREAFPSTPWIFVYRSPVQVMRSHLKTKGTNMAVCLRSRRHPQKDLVDLVRRIGNTTPSKLSNEEFCAAHLASLCEVASKQVKDSSGLGKVVNYDRLISSLVDTIIPKHFLGVDALPQRAKDNIDGVSEFYSKGRKGGMIWNEDSQQKEETAWQEMKDACSVYLQPSYDELETFQNHQWN